MRRGPKSKPSGLFALEGGKSRRSREGEPQPSPRPPRPPRELTKRARKLWRLWAPEAERMGVLTTVDGPAFAMLCQCYADYLDLRALLANMPARVYSLRDKEGRDRQLIPVPQVAMARQAMADFLRCAAEFGYTPSARADVSVPRDAERAPIARYVTK